MCVSFTLLLLGHGFMSFLTQQTHMADRISALRTLSCTVVTKPPDQSQDLFLRE